MNDNIYNIDFNKITRWNIPPVLRASKLLAFMKILALPFVFVYQDFLNFRKAKLYDLMITPQVCYLESMLNERYDYAQRRIYISDGLEFPPLYLYKDEEIHPVNLYTDAENSPVYLYTDGEGGDYTNDFIVMVPKDVSFSIIEMRSVLMRKRLAGMRFKIQTF